LTLKQQRSNELQKTLKEQESLKQRGPPRFVKPGDVVTLISVPGSDAAALENAAEMGTDAMPLVVLAIPLAGSEAGPNNRSLDNCFPYNRPLDNLSIYNRSPYNRSLPNFSTF